MELLESDGADRWGLSEAKAVSEGRKVAVIYTLLAACVADPHEVTGATASTNVEGVSKGDIIVKAGYDARQRVALRLLVLWLDIDWTKVVSEPLHFAYKNSARKREREAIGTHGFSCKLFLHPQRRLKLL